MVSLTQSQASALEKLRQSKDALISLAGAAGTGKTTLIEHLMGGDTVVCTPTNKAAQVLNAKGIPATTFFKTFYMLDERKKPLRFIPCARHPGNLPKGKLAYVDRLIIDEASMVTARMVQEMRQMCGQLILIGDPHQLPPVNDPEHPAGYFATLKHTAELTEIMRQAEGSNILELASEIRRKGPKVERLLDTLQPAEDQTFADLIKNGALVIAFTNNERRRINHVCRRILGITSPTPVPGDRMVVTNNFSEDLINGTFATVVSFDWDGVSDLADIVLVNETGTAFSTVMRMKSFVEDQIASVQNKLGEHYIPPDRIDEDDVRLELTWAYCLTAHKAQGSEWPSVVVIDQRQLIKKIQQNSSRPGLHPEEYARRWLYTAVTRARQQLVVTQGWFAQSYSQVL